jgi:hypothetical protein
MLCHYVFSASAFAEPRTETMIVRSGDEVTLTAPPGMVLSKPPAHTSPLTKADEHKTICAAGSLFEVVSVSDDWNSATLKPVRSWFGWGEQKTCQMK